MTMESHVGPIQDRQFDGVWPTFLLGQARFRLQYTRKSQALFQLPLMQGRAAGRSINVSWMYICMYVYMDKPAPSKQTLSRREDELSMVMSSAASLLSLFIEFIHSFAHSLISHSAGLAPKSPQRPERNGSAQRPNLQSRETSVVAVVVVVVVTIDGVCCFGLLYSALSLSLSPSPTRMYTHRPHRHAPIAPWPDSPAASLIPIILHPKLHNVEHQRRRALLCAL